MIIYGNTNYYLWSFSALTLGMGELLRLYLRLIGMHFWSEQSLKEDELCLEMSIQSISFIEYLTVAKTDCFVFLGASTVF